jgi:hypothetical protein
MIPVVVPIGFILPPAPRVALTPLVGKEVQSLQEWRESVARESTSVNEEVEHFEDEGGMIDREI